MRIRFALLLTALVLLAPRIDAATLPVGTRAELFTLKVANRDVVDKPIFSLNQMVGEGASSPKKLVLISFFATYCEPCKKELPVLEELHKRYADKGLGVLVVSIDKDRDVPGGAAEAVAKIGVEKKLTYPILHDRFNIVAKRYGVEKLPCLYLVDGAGNVALTNVGYTEEFTDVLTREVQTRLGVPIEKIESATTEAAPKAATKVAPKGKKK